MESLALVEAWSLVAWGATPIDCAHQRCQDVRDGEDNGWLCLDCGVAMVTNTPIRKGK